MKILGIIPARGGSKGVEHKNTRFLAGKSLIQRTFECAKDAGALDRIILSSDDDEAIQMATEIGLEVPFKRPKELAKDDTPMLPVIIHALSEMIKNGYEPDAVLILQPTSPFRSPSHIKRAVALLAQHDSVCSVVPLPKTLCPHYVMKLREDGYLENFLSDGGKYTRRQDVPQAYTRDGTIFAVKSNIVLKNNSLYGEKCYPLILDPKEVMSIDTVAQWEEAERRLAEENRVDL
jgi:CMP-N,N'-diacetyllegionaminic acid synthase